MIPYQLALKIHGQVNANVEFKADTEFYSKPDFWTVAEKYGDCEDYALAKRKLLHEAGFGGNLVRLCLCRTEENEMHAVLVVTTDRGEYVLDNRHQLPLPRRVLTSVGYRWSSIEENGQWFTVS